MAVVGTLLFAFYLAVATIALAMFGTGTWPLIALGTLAIIGFQYILGKKMALRSVGAEDMPEEGQYARIHRTVESLSRDMGIEKPRLMVAQMGVPNAFATGRKGAGVVVVSEELIHLLDDDELDGVIAHELAHIRNRDVLTMTIGQSIAMVVGMAVHYIVIFTGENSIADYVLGYIAGLLAQMFVMLFVLAISRYREYVADADAADAIGSGDPLARALVKIQSGSQGRQPVSDDVSALCIFGDASKLLSTHPPAEKRIEKLRSHV